MANTCAHSPLLINSEDFSSPHLLPPQASDSLVCIVSSLPHQFIRITPPLQRSSASSVASDAARMTAAVNEKDTVIEELSRWMVGRSDEWCPMCWARRGAQTAQVERLSDHTDREHGEGMEDRDEG